MATCDISCQNPFFWEMYADLSSCIPVCVFIDFPWFSVNPTPSPHQKPSHNSRVQIGVEFFDLLARTAILPVGTGRSLQKNLYDLGG